MRVAVTSYGIVTPFGEGVAQAVAGLKRGRTCAQSETVALAQGAFTVVSARVPGARPARPAEAFLRAAVHEARVPEGAPLFYGTCSGEMSAFERWFADDTLPRENWYEAPAQNVAAEAHLVAPRVFTSACTSGLVALHAARTAIVRGEISRAVVAASDATCAFTASGFFTLRAASAEPARPFSRSRSGLNFGEGAAALVLESEAAAHARAANVLFYLHGTGLSADAKHVTAPRPDGQGLELAVRSALGALRPDVYVAHGTATQANDAMELTLGGRLALRDRPWLAHKGLIGHAMGASGLISLVLAVEQMRAGFDTPPAYDDAEVQLGTGVQNKRTGVIAAAAFGGSNAAAAWTLA